MTCLLTCGNAGTGPPLGSQRLYDVALEKVFGSDAVAKFAAESGGAPAHGGSRGAVAGGSGAVSVRTEIA